MSGQEIINLFKGVCKKLQDTQSLLSDAQETIKILESEIAHMKYDSENAYETVHQQLNLTKSVTGQTAQIKNKHGGTWIEDVWLSSPSTANLFSEAEIAWIENPRNPQKALNLCMTILKREDLTRRDRILCTLFQSALLLSIGSLQDSCARANSAIYDSGSDWRYKDLRSIGHFLRGRYLLERRKFKAAFWDLSLVVFAEGYRDRAKELRDQAEMDMMGESDGDILARPIHLPAILG